MAEVSGVFETVFKRYPLVKTLTTSLTAGVVEELEILRDQIIHIEHLYQLTGYIWILL